MNEGEEEELTQAGMKQENPDEVAEAAVTATDQPQEMTLLLPLLLPRETLSTRQPAPA